MFYRVVLLVQDGVEPIGNYAAPFENVREHIKILYQVDANGRRGDDSYVVEIDPMPIPNEVAMAQKNIVFPPHVPQQIQVEDDFEDEDEEW